MNSKRDLAWVSVLGCSLALAGLNAHAQGTLGRAAGQNRASEATNFEFGVESTDSDTADSTSNGRLGGKLRATIPLGSLFAVSLAGGYSEATVRTRDVLTDAIGSISGVRPTCTFDSTHGEATLFARRPTLGKVSLTYGIGSISADCGANSQFLATGSDSMDTEGYRAEIEFYLYDFTLSAARTSTDLEDGPKLESTELSASWYPHDSVSISLSGNDLYEQDTYGVAIEHQPQFLGDAFSVQLGYSRTDQDPRTNTIHLGLTYFFGTRVSLKTRDRHYR